MGENLGINKIFERFLKNPICKVFLTEKQEFLSFHVSRFRDLFNVLNFLHFKIVY